MMNFLDRALNSKAGMLLVMGIGVLVLVGLLAL